ncbi:hypothetical protein ACFQ1I_33075 [Kitasatospora arboriphila]
MFRGSLLPFLLSSPSDGVDRDLLDRVLAIFSDDRDLTVIDRKVLEIAAEISPGAEALQADVLIANSERALRGLEYAGGAFCAPPWTSSAAIWTRSSRSTCRAGI